MRLPTRFWWAQGILPVVTIWRVHMLRQSCSTRYPELFSRQAIWLIRMVATNSLLTATDRPGDASRTGHGRRRGITSTTAAARQVTCAILVLLRVIRRRRTTVTISGSG